MRELESCATMVGALVMACAASWAGPVTPPAGAVSGTHKTLTEVEPRVAVSGANTPGDGDSVYRITQAGSYYLTGNLNAGIGKNGIEIAASGVTLDLNGFEVVGQTGFTTVDGIVSTTTGLSDITIRNGTVRDWPGSGISLSAVIASECLVEHVNARDNVGTGIFVHSYGRIISCSSSGNGGAGIWAVNSSLISGCLAFGNSGHGIQVSSGHSIVECVSYGNGQTGIAAGEASMVVRCSAYSNDGDGVFVADAGLVSECVAGSNAQDGIGLGSGSTAIHNTCSGNGYLSGDGAGIVVTGSGGLVANNQCENNDRGIDVNGSDNRIDGNSCIGNGVSYDIDGANNLVIRNTATGGSPNYSIGAGNSVAPRVSVAGSDGWNGISNANHPWANLGY